MESITRTIGKNTIGDNNKMKVDLKTYNRSTNDLGYIWRNTQTVGTLVPFMCEVGQRGDVKEVDLMAKVLTHPTVGPLFGSFKFQADIFVCPIRLYNAWLHNNKLGIGLDISQINLPQLKAHIKETDNWDGINNYQVNPSSILSYLGTNGYGNISTGYECDVNINAIPLLGYWDIVKNFYANKQEANAYVYSIEKTFTNGQVTDSSSVVKGTINNLSSINISVNQNYKIILNHNLGRALTTDEIKELEWEIIIGSVVNKYTIS